MKPFYTEYVGHALRFFSHFVEKCPENASDADTLNWYACYSVLEKHEHREAVLEVFYHGHQHMTEAIAESAKAHGLTMNALWASVNDVEKQIAISRGLI